MKYSIRSQLTFVFACLMAGTILICLFINGAFLEKIYINKRQDAMLEGYRLINSAVQNDLIDKEEFDVPFQDFCGRNNLEILVLDSEAEMVRSSTPEYSFMGTRLLEYALDLDSDDSNSEKRLRTGQRYETWIHEDQRMNQKYMDMWGILDNGNMFMIRSAVEGIKDSARLSGEFFGIVGLLALCFSIVIIHFVSEKITEPIRELTHISAQMKQLDFDAKYKGDSKTEVALLGQNINELSETLEKTISELKSANNELKKDLEKREKIEEMRTDFLSSVSHELKTPLALIQGYAEGLSENVTEDEESRRYYCEVIQDEASKMTGLVSKLISLNQLEFGDGQVNFERFDIVQYLYNFLQTQKILWEQKDVTLVYENVNPIMVWSDEFLVSEVVNNFFSNALNYVDKGGVIRISVITKEKKARVSIYNTGENIPEESLLKLWDKFYKVDKARTRAYGGNGIGLSIVKAIMEKIHQEYGVNNMEGGVEFWFELECQ